MKLCEDTITLFNAYLDEDSGFTEYSPTIIRGVSWYGEVASAVDSDGLHAADRYTIRIPVDADFSGKSYVEPAAFAGADKSTSFTLKEGDLIIHGQGTEVAIDSDDVDSGTFTEQNDPSYTDGENIEGGSFTDRNQSGSLSGLTPAQLQKKYGEVVTILGVTDNRRAPHAKHWKVIGK